MDTMDAPSKNQDGRSNRSRRDWPYFTAAAMGLLGFISLFLPALRVPALSIDISFVGALDVSVILLLLAFAAIVAFSVTYLLGRQRWADTTAAALTLVAGVWATFWAIVNWSGAAGIGASVGIGLILLLIVGLVSIAMGMLLLVQRGRTTERP